MARLGILIDTSKCTGCRGCQVACKQWNGLPAEKTQFFGGDGYQNPKDLSGKTFTLVFFKERDEENLRWLFRKHQCMQCTIASCVNVCPVKALSKHPDGYTVRDRGKCIGCGLCVANCPFKIPRINEEDKKADSCRFCRDRVENNLIPACAKTCPSGAIQFGERENLLKIARDRVSTLGGKANLYGETQCGGLGVLYILLDDPEVYNLPKSPKTAEVPSWEELVDVLSKFSLLGIGSLALQGLSEKERDLVGAR